MRTDTALLVENYKNALFAAALILALCVSAYAVGDELVKRILGWGGNLVIDQRPAEDGEVAAASVSLGKLAEPVEIADGRMYFVVNDERLDITDQVSADKPFHYSYEDSEGYTHHWLIGLNSDEPENYGFAEFIRDSSGDWKDGEARWFVLGKDALNVPWS